MFGSNQNRTLIGVFLLLFTFSVKGGTIEDVEGATKIIWDINQRQFAFEEKLKDLITGTDGGGSIAAYYDQKILKKIHLRVVLSNKAIVYNLFYIGENLLVIERQERFQKWNKEKQIFALGDYKPAQKTVFLLNPMNQSGDKLSEMGQASTLSGAEAKALMKLAVDAQEWMKSMENTVDVEHQLKRQFSP